MPRDVGSNRRALGAASELIDFQRLKEPKHRKEPKDKSRDSSRHHTMTQKIVQILEENLI